MNSLRIENNLLNYYKILIIWTLLNFVQYDTARGYRCTSHFETSREIKISEL